MRQLTAALVFASLLIASNAADGAIMQFNSDDSEFAQAAWEATLPTSGVESEEFTDLDFTPLNLLEVSNATSGGVGGNAQRYEVTDPSAGPSVVSFFHDELQFSHIGFEFSFVQFPGLLEAVMAGSQNVTAGPIEAFNEAAFLGFTATDEDFIDLVTISHTDLGGNFWELNRIVYVTVIPEPASAAILLIGIGLLSCGRHVLRPAGQQAS